MTIGYARVSTYDQRLDLQTDALTAAGCEKICIDHASGKTTERPGLDEALAYARDGDTLSVWRLDRLGRSLPDLIEIVNGLAERGVGFRSLTEGIDTTTPGGRLVFHFFAALAEFERDLIRERTMAGLFAARARGKMGGRIRRVTVEQEALIRELSRDRSKTIGEICKAFGIGRTTFYRYADKPGPPYPTPDASEVENKPSD